MLFVIRPAMTARQNDLHINNNTGTSSTHSSRKPSMIAGNISSPCVDFCFLRLFSILTGVCLRVWIERPIAQKKSIGGGTIGKKSCRNFHKCEEFECQFEATFSSALCYCTAENLL